MRDTFRIVPVSEVPTYSTRASKYSSIYAAVTSLNVGYAIGLDYETVKEALAFYRCATGRYGRDKTVKVSLRGLSVYIIRVSKKAVKP